VAVVGAGALLAWTCAIAFQRIDAVMGGAAGRVVVSSLSPRAVLLVSVALLVVAALATTALRRSAFGLRLRTVGASSAFAEAVGIDVSRARTGAHGFSGACAGVAGGLLVEGVGLADWTTYGVHLSFLLLAAVVVGGATSATGAAVGVALASLLSSASATVLAALGDAAAVDVAPPVADALLAITVLVAIGSRGLVPRFRRRPPTATGAELPAAIRASLGVTGLTVRFGDVLALDGLAFTAAPSSVTALVGANGAGKSTVLAAIAGALAPSAGTITIDPPAAGVARTLQDPQLPPAMTAFECVVAASDRVRRRGGMLRGLLSTPAARAEQRAVEGRAASLLALASLAALADVPVVEIAPGERGLLAAICAVATGASVLLLDEAAAGGGVVGRARFDGLVRTLRAGGRTVVLVEHDRRLVADLADVVVVVDPPPVGFGR
jgi:ABC-type branched-subunit amino acid transport system ATPase component